jgi:CRISPR-associated DxTHG motif protein
MTGYLSWKEYDTPAGIRARLLQHASHKDHWSRAVLIQLDTTHGLNSAQVAWLEGRVYDPLSAAQDVTLHNKNRPGDETLPAFNGPHWKHRLSRSCGY